MKKNKTSRRDFLIDSAQAAMFLPAVDTVFASLLRSALQPRQAHAAAPFKSFIHLNLYAAPPRWMFDLFLNPANDASKFMASKQVTNKFVATSGVYTDATYALTRYGTDGPYVPHLWSLAVPKVGGGTIAASSLLANMLNIRGINVLNAAHLGAAELHQSAIIGSPTISSLTADKATLSASAPTRNLIRSIALNGSVGNTFISAAGHSQFAYNVSGNNDLANMFASFQPISVANGFNATFVSNRSALQDKVNSALTSLSPLAQKYYQNVLSASNASMRILSGSATDTFTQLSNEWADLFGKYKGLITATLGRTYAGINDKRVGRAFANNTEKRLYQFADGEFIQNKNASDAVDLRLMLENVNADILAGQFAVTEFLATRQLCPSINVTIPAFRNVRVNERNANMTFDQHFTGSMPGVLMNTMYYLCYTSCLLELIRTLKAANLFKDTLIYMASEFNRAARVDGSGADHGSMAGHVSLISGRINAFRIIGNIYKDAAGDNSPYSATYKGTWGAGAPFVDNKHLSIVQVWASVMRTLGMSLPDIPNAVKKDRLIFNEVGSLSVASLYNKAPRNVAN